MNLKTLKTNKKKTSGILDQQFFLTILFWFDTTWKI